jgi:hypothetical protein
MTAASRSPFDVVARVLSERLHGCKASEELRALIGSPGTSWPRVLSYAGAEYVLPAFAAALRDLGLIGSLDRELGAFLEAVHAANVERNGEIGNELEAAVGVLNRAGIEPVLLKGAIRLVDELYPDHGWRMLRDIDLLIPPTSLAEVIRAFGEVGYIHLNLSGNEIQRLGGLVQIDLHDELFSRLLPATEVIEASRSAALGNGRVRLPSIEHQLVHLIGHSQIRHRGHACGLIALRDRLEAAALVSWGHENVDWQSVEARFRAAGYRRPLLTFLLALKDCALCALPVPARIDLLTALQLHRVALQARSTTFAHIGALAGWCGSEVKSQLAERDAGRPRAIKNLKRLLFERGAACKMARALGRRRWFLRA